jgi:cob(I)alamin adenosyltransferase
MVRALGVDPEFDRVVADLQRDLFDVGADLATPLEATVRASLHPLDDADIARLEQLIDRFDEQLEPLMQFILPAGHLSSAALHHARAITRRAERATVTLAAMEGVNPAAIVYLNRLSDLLFTMARAANARNGVSEARFHVPRRTRGDT